MRIRTVLASLVTVQMLLCAAAAAAAENVAPGPETRLTLATPTDQDGLLIGNKGQESHLWMGRRGLADWDDSQWLNINSAGRGIRLMAKNYEAIVLDEYGGIYLQGSVYFGGTLLDPRWIESLHEISDMQKVFWRMQLLLVAVNLFITVLVCRFMLRRWVKPS